MRIEDLDAPRVVEGSAESICDDLRWLGLDWDEGPVWQSERHDRYELALARLREAGLVYPCSCSRKEIAALASAPHGDDDLGPRYPGTCRDGAQHPDRPCSVRFRMTDAGDDFVLRRADGIWSYQLAVVVDDAEMGITEIVRGADLLSSTPRQVALHRALGYEPPEFLHVPLVHGSDGARLSKRHGAAAIAELRRDHPPEEVIGMLAGSLGMPARPARADELVEGFSPLQIPSNPHVLGKE